MIVFRAMLVDAYRQLNSKRLFWVILSLSFTVVVFYGSIGFNEDGMSMFFGLWQIDSPILREGSPMARILYISIFSSFFVEIWLAWIATILALRRTQGALRPPWNRSALRGAGDRAGFLRRRRNRTGFRQARHVGADAGHV